MQLADSEKVYTAIAPRDCLPAAPKMAVGTDFDADIFDAREVSRDGAMVLVRPDQYVAAMLPLGAVEGRGALLERSLLPSPESGPL